MTVLDKQAIQGAGGGKGGGGGSEAKDTLRSIQTAQLIDLISEGEIKGLVNGLKSVYLDGVPVENPDGSKNFESLSFALLPGTQGQAALPGFDTVQSERGVSVEIKTSTPVVQTIVNPSVDSCRVTISVPQLTKLDTGSGDLNGDAFTYAIDVQSAGGGFVTVHQETVSGKTTSNYKHATRFSLPGSAPWDIRVRRLTADSSSSAQVNAFHWDSLTEIQSVALRYPNSAVAGLQVSARQFSRIPGRAYDILGLCVRVPSNYDPIAGTYAGIWDGSFKIAWTNNPAWIYFDLATHPRYGLGQYIKDHHLNKWQLYAIGRYCDERVPDGQGGTEPRVACNLYLQTFVQARQALQDLAGLMRAITYWGNGQIALVQDAPTDAQMLFTNANVVGDFQYESVSRKTRHSVWTVYYNDLAQLGKRVPAVYVDKDLVRSLGVVNESFSPIGCTSRGQAMRLARWAAFSEAWGRTVSFRAGLEAVGIGPGAVIKVADRNKAGKRLGGRVRSATLSEVTLDAPVTLEAGQAYQLEVMLPDASVALGYRTEKRQVTTGEGQVQTLTVSPAFSVAPAKAAVWVLQPTNIQPTWWRVVGRKEVAGSNEFDLVAVAHDPDKFAAIEQGLKLAPKPTSGLSVISPQVSEVRLTETPYMDGAMPRIRATVSWPEPGPGMRYRINWRLNNGPWTTLPETSANAVDLDGLQPGMLEVTVQTINSLGRPSVPVPASLVLAGKVTPPADAEGMAVLLGPAGWLQSWSEPPDPDYSASEVRRDGVNFDLAVFVFKGKANQVNLGWLSAGTHTIRLVHWAGTRRSANPKTNQIIVQAPGPAAITAVHQSVYACEVVFGDATTSQPLKAVQMRVGLLADSWETAQPLATAPGGARSWSVNLSKGNKRLFTRAEDAFGNLGAVSTYDLMVEGYSATELLDTLGGQLTTNQLNQALRTKIENIDTIGAAVSQEVQTRTTLTDGLSAQYALKAQVVRGDGKVVFGGIGLSATANGNVSQSEILLTASRLTFVPDSDLSATPVPLLTTGVVGGQQTVVMRSALVGDLAVTNRMIAGGITAEKLITNGLVVRDDAGNPIFSANVKLVSSRIEPAEDWKNSNVGGVNMVWGAGNNPVSAGQGTYGVGIFTIKDGADNPNALLPGETVTISADLWQDAASAAAGQAATLILYCDGPGGWFESASIYGYSQTRERKSATVTLPTDPNRMVYVRVGLWHQGGVTGNQTGTVYADRIQVERSGVATQYKPGAQPGATVGATWGSNLGGRPGNLAGLAGSEAIKNGDIGINASGELWGVGGGNGTKVSNSQISISTDGKLLNGGAVQGQAQSLPVVEGRRNSNDPPSYYAPSGTGVHVREFKDAQYLALPSPREYWCTLETIGQYSPGSGAGQVVQFAYSGIYTYRRASNDANEWGSWVRDLDRTAYTGDLNATNGATLGVNVGGKITPSNASTLIDNAALGSALIGELTTANLKVTTVSRAINGIPEGSAQQGARVELSTNSLMIYRSNGAAAIRISA